MKPIPVSQIKRSVRQRLKEIAQPARRRLSGIAPRSTKDYATHIPILVGLSKAFKIQRVLELGCGEFSTLTFLNQYAFTELTRLDSFETDESWLLKVNERVGVDSRFFPHAVNGVMAQAIRDQPIGEFDLVFVDDSMTAQERGQTIKELSRKNSINVLIAIHDFEVSDYRAAAIGFEHCHTFKAFTPQTGIVWNGDPHPFKALQVVESKIKRFAKWIEPDDVEGWLMVLSGG